MAILHKLLLAVILASLAACANSSVPPDTADAGNPSAGPEIETTLACTSDAECVVKDIGNCCGYFPACVHRDQAVDPLAVRQRCIEQGMQSICGFVEIKACMCVDNACRPADAGGELQ